MNTKHVVVIGGGFAGINLVRELADEPSFTVTLIDRNNYNFFQPLLYQVATGLLEVSSIASPFRTILKTAPNVNFRLGTVESVDLDHGVVHLSDGLVMFDSLVIATGTRTNYFGLDGVEQNALPMKTVDDALALRNHLLRKAEEATTTNDPDERSRLLTFVISGAGPTGVELAGMLGEMRGELLVRLYPELSPEDVRIVLVDAAPTVLPPMTAASQKYTQQTLEQMGVQVTLDTRVEDYRDGVVYFANGESISTATLVWASGVTGDVLDGIPVETYSRGKRLLVDEFNQVVGASNVFAIGDASLDSSDERYPNGHPQLAAVAMRQGRHLARNLIAAARGRSMTPFRYADRGAMAIIGRSKATTDLTSPRATVSGWLAWVMWVFVHVLQLMGYRNRLSTIWDWVTAYIHRDQSLGMIIGVPSEPRPQKLPHHDSASFVAQRAS